MGLGGVLVLLKKIELTLAIQTSCSFTMVESPGGHQLPIGKVPALACPE